MQTTVLLPEKLDQEVEKQVKEGKFASKSQFVESAVKTYLDFQKGQVSWETLAGPFRAYARKKKLTEKDILSIIEKGRSGKSSQDR